MSAPGWYGKLPFLGDFASRRLSQSFIQPWDAWLQQGVAASRAELGEAWLDTFLTSDIWRFVLAADCLTPEPWAGILVPSVDRVGRYFPLTIAAPYASASRLDEWFADLESAAHAGLSASEVEAFDSALHAIALPAPSNGPVIFAPLEIGSQLGSQAVLAANDLLAGLLAGHSLWLACNAEGQQAGFVCQGMPRPDVFTRMLAYTPA
ncbi:type VI secretion system-associated protein TagF [Uliginosibacterium flavum]|uniref:Type VI secretion system-associated protein TagF n=1 Tax=Uliginosibacterium flavum TaxID=1396831 RepID=A0ABV2TF76_9RHOO